MGALSASDGHFIVDAILNLGRSGELALPLGLQLLQLNLLFHGNLVGSLVNPLLGRDRDIAVDLRRKGELLGILLVLVLLRGLVLLHVHLRFEVQVQVAVTHRLLFLVAQQLSISLPVDHWVISQLPLFLLHFGLLNLMESVDVALHVVGVQQDAHDVHFLV